MRLLCLASPPSASSLPLIAVPFVAFSTLVLLQLGATGARSESGGVDCFILLHIVERQNAANSKIHSSRKAPTKCVDAGAPAGAGG